MHKPTIPTPWTIIGDNKQPLVMVHEDSDGYTQIIAEIISAENADYIVRACNAYPLMRAFLKQLQGNTGECIADHPQWVKIIDELLALRAPTDQ